MRLNVTGYPKDMAKAVIEAALKSTRIRYDDLKIKAGDGAASPIEVKFSTKTPSDNQLLVLKNELFKTFPALHLVVEREEEESGVEYHDTYLKPKASNGDVDVQISIWTFDDRKHAKAKGVPAYEAPKAAKPAQKSGKVVAKGKEEKSSEKKAPKKEAKSEKSSKAEKTSAKSGKTEKKKEKARA